MLFSGFFSGALILAMLAQTNTTSCVLVAPINSPFSATIQDPFRQPSCERCAGNRGIEYNTQPGTPISAGSSGTISFYGQVGGTKYLVIKTTAGRRLTYGSIASTNLRLGAAVLAGQIIGATGTTLYFGVRETSLLKDKYSDIYATLYVDPAKYLTRNSQVSSRAILVSGAGVGIGSVDRGSAC